MTPVVNRAASSNRFATRLLPCRDVYDRLREMAGVARALGGHLFAALRSRRSSQPNQMMTSIGPASEPTRQTAHNGASNGTPEAIVTAMYKPNSADSKSAVLNDISKICARTGQFSSPSACRNHTDPRRVTHMTEWPSDCVLPDDELMLRLDVRQFHCASIAMATWVGPLGRFGRLVLRTLCPGTFN
jgi:hypothetical protein